MSIKKTTKIHPPNVLIPIKWSLLLRLTCLILLCIFIPFATIGLYEQGKYIPIIFQSVITLMLIPELCKKLFYKPVSAILKDQQIVVKYYHGKLKTVALTEIKGYSITEEYTRYGIKKGVALYLNNDKHINFTEINTKNLSPLLDYLNRNKVHYYGP